MKIKLDENLGNRGADILRVAGHGPARGTKRAGTRNDRSRRSSVRGQTDNGLSVVSLFTGAMGLDLGLEEAGFRTAVAVESNPDATATIRSNRPRIPVIEQPISQVTTAEILETAGLEAGKVTLVAGGPACQSFSTAGKREALGSASGSLIYEFVRVVKEARPEFFLMENVRGLLSSAVLHRPLNRRGPGHPPLRDEEELGSAFRKVTGLLGELGYYVVFDVLNAADFGVAQTRQRLVLIGSRDGRPVTMPTPSHGEDGRGNRPGWRTLREALAGVQGGEGECVQFVPSRRRYLAHVPLGGNWRDLPEEMRAEALGGAHRSWGGRTGFLRRLSWDRPCPTLNADPDHKATALCHPDKLRPLSVLEYARVQGFPDGWVVVGTVKSKYRQLGNAVPVELGRALGTAVVRARYGRRRSGPLGEVECHDLGLLDRLSARLRTRLNPPRMREGSEGGTCGEWRGGRPAWRDDASAYVPGHLIGAVGKAKTASKVTRKLREAYGTPDLGNYREPVDELFFILLSQRTTGPSYERVFAKFKEWAGDWGTLRGKAVGRIARVIARAGLGKQKAQHVVGIVERLHAEFGRITLEPLRGQSDTETEAFLTSLPGVGVKTAKCVMLFSLDREVLPVDGHVARVAKRVGLVDPSASRARTHEVLEEVVPRKLRFDFHVNAVVHGRTLCKARDPKCGECPVRRVCCHWDSGRSDSH